MESYRKRHVYSAEFKATLALQAVRGLRTVGQIAQVYGVHPRVVGRWKRRLLEQSDVLFQPKPSSKLAGKDNREDRLYSEIGRLKMEVDLLRRKLRMQG
ncbi:transposase [Pseudoduganella namucuonensis]|uniref:transposase n=1 Tax=Pseudoduganella namucuonensis TaxID=1035707 RepID=UPI000B80B4EB